MTLTMRADVPHCPRCWLNHTNVTFHRLTHPTDEMQWWATCPVTKQPILAPCTQGPKPETKEMAG